VATSPPTPPHTPKAAYINFGMWGRVLDVINHAKFQLDRFRGFGAPLWAENRYLPTPLQQYALTCYTVKITQDNSRSTTVEAMFPIQTTPHHNNRHALVNPNGNKQRICP